MFYNELDYLDDEEVETICSSKIPTEDKLEDNLNKVIDEKLLHSFYLLGKYDVKIERAYREGFRSGLALTISVTALLLSIIITGGINMETTDNINAITEIIIGTQKWTYNIPCDRLKAYSGVDVLQTTQLLEMFINRKKA